ncbi:MAG TPA: peptide deformylase [Rhodospirillaceae bacterium]|nr:peptide deformylase [Rhodospirillaceae bacterium]HAT35785.1 peptide deformylase [Rhodospirillaceae bacterium]
MGHEVLRRECAPVEDPTAPEIAQLATDLIETCEDVGGNGIAAPQIYEPIRMFVYRVRRDVMPAGSHMTEIPWTVAINPTFEPVDKNKKHYWERCLSLPGLYGQVPRFTDIRFEAAGLDGEVSAFTAHGFHARLLQHETDHLNGVLYPDRIEDMTTLGFVSELGPAAYPPLPRDAEDFRDPTE